MLLFFYINALVLVIGAEINSVIDFETLNIKPGATDISEATAKAQYAAGPPPAQKRAAPAAQSLPAKNTKNTHPSTSPSPPPPPPPTAPAISSSSPPRSSPPATPWRKAWMIPRETPPPGKHVSSTGGGPGRQPDRSDNATVSKAWAASSSTPPPAPAAAAPPTATPADAASPPAPQKLPVRNRRQPRHHLPRLNIIHRPRAGRPASTRPPCARDRAPRTARPASRPTPAPPTRRPPTAPP